jgi:hypothetical protein
LPVSFQLVIGRRGQEFKKLFIPAQGRSADLPDATKVASIQGRGVYIKGEQFKVQARVLTRPRHMEDVPQTGESIAF